MYEWDLGRGVRTVPMGPELQSIHETRAAIMEPIVRQAIAAAGPEATVVDLACSEGWFGHRLLEWGASRVLGVDLRPENIRRAELVRNHLRVDADRLSFRVGDVYDLGGLGVFDVVLCLGLIYHLENPIGALRVARTLTGGVCLVESQLVEPHAALRHTWGTSGEFLEQEAAWAAWREPVESQDRSPIASRGGVVSLIPNRAAMVDGLSAAGFSRVQELPVPAGLNAQYVEGHRLVLAGWP
jgi:tRNA (mo5U34)-methyltransferase